MSAAPTVPRAAAMTRGAAPSPWLAELEPMVPRAPLVGEHSADVCIVGAGLTGLWTAYELKRAEPGLEIIVLESEIAGFGASGRNGGWVLGRLAGSTERWIRWGGRAGARALEREILATVDEVGEVVAREGIRCDFVKGGTLTVARSELQRRRLQEALRRAERLGVGTQGRCWLDRARVEERVAVADALGGVFMSQCARVQPARLVRGLAEVVERLGVHLYERSPVTRVGPRLVHSAQGWASARHIVLATEGYTARMPGLRRRLLPMNSAMILTEPLGAELWSQIGWEGAETLSDGAHVYVYLQRTADGRIAIGGRGVPYRYGSRTDREGPVAPATVRQLRERLTALFPALDGVGVCAAWAGVLGVARDWMPRVQLDHATGIAWAGGYVGEGVAAANLAGRTLRDLLLGRDSELVRLPWVRAAARDWEPEPFRFAGSRGVYALYRLADRREAASGRPALAARVADLVAGR